MDIKFEKDGYKFNVRSSCIIKDKYNNVLLTKMRAIDGAYILPGGRVELLETTSSAIKRELNEELGLSINQEYKLISIEEDFNKIINFHMLEFVYYTEVDNFDFLNNIDQSWDQFEIFDITNIDNIDIRPKTIIELIKQNNYNIITNHSNYDWGDKKIK